MCSELTPRAHVPDNRIPQLMQPWLTGKLFPEQLCVWVCGLLLHRCLVDPMSNHCHAGLERGSLACVLIGGKLHQCEFFRPSCFAPRWQDEILILFFSVTSPTWGRTQRKERSCSLKADLTGLKISTRWPRYSRIDGTHLVGKRLICTMPFFGLYNCRRSAKSGKVR